MRARPAGRPRRRVRAVLGPLLGDLRLLDARRVHVPRPGDCRRRADRRGAAGVPVDAVAPSLTITSGRLPCPTTDTTSTSSSRRQPDARARFECTHVFPDGERAIESTANPGLAPRPRRRRAPLRDRRVRRRAGNADARSRGRRPSTRRRRSRSMPEASEFDFLLRAGRARHELRMPARGPPAFAPAARPALVRPSLRATTRSRSDDRRRGQPRRRVSRAFTVAAPQPIATATPEPQPVATPRPVATPTPTPQAGRTVVARAVSGRILVKRANSNEFVELRGTDGIPVGSEVNAKNGRVALTIEPGNGKPTQRAVFYGGIFKLSQPGATLDLTLSEPLAACKKSENGADEGQVAQALGRRQGQVPHARPLQLGDGARHDLARPGHLRGHADARPPGRRLRARQRPRQDGARPRRAQLSGQTPPPLAVWRLPRAPRSG